MIFRSSAFAALLAIAPLPASAQQTPFDPLLHGALVYYGNYCGPGNRGENLAPVDALDAACRRHDLCSGTAQIISCACNARLAREAASVADDGRAPQEERVAADFTSRGISVLPCSP